MGKQSFPEALYVVTIERHPTEERPIRVCMLGTRKEILTGVGLDVAFEDLDRVEHADDPHDPFPE